MIPNSKVHHKHKKKFFTNVFIFMNLTKGSTFQPPPKNTIFLGKFDNVPLDRGTFSSTMLR